MPAGSLATHEVSTVKFSLVLIVVLGVSSCAHRPLGIAVDVEDISPPEFYQWATEEAAFRFERMAMPATASMRDCSSPDLCDDRIYPACRDLDSSSGRDMLARVRWICEHERRCLLRRSKEVRALREPLEAALRQTLSARARVSHKFVLFESVDRIVSQVSECDYSYIISDRLLGVSFDIAYEVLGDPFPAGLAGRFIVDGVAFFAGPLGRHGELFQGRIAPGRHRLGLWLDSHSRGGPTRIEASHLFVPIRGRHFKTALMITIGVHERSPRIRVHTVVTPDAPTPFPPGPGKPAVARFPQ